MTGVEVTVDPLKVITEVDKYMADVTSVSIEEHDQLEFQSFVETASKFDAVHAAIASKNTSSTEAGINRLKTSILDGARSKGGVANDFYMACAVNPKLMAEYQAATTGGWSETRAIRAQWAETEKLELEKTAVHEESYQKLDHTKTRYLTAGGLVLDMG